MNKEEVMMMAFQLIGFAGDAYSHFFQAITHAGNGKFEEAEQEIAEGKKSMVSAHNAQTELLSGEAEGKEMEYSILMVHAQDHLNAAIMYERLSVEFVKLYRELFALKGSGSNE